MKTIDDLEAVALANGGHKSVDAGLCLMEAVAWFNDEPHSDHPQCASPALTRFGIGLNDRFDDEYRQKLKPLIPQLVGTRNPALEARRAYFLTDRAIRLFVPMALGSTGNIFERRNLMDQAATLRQHAKALEDLAEVNAETIEGARRTCDAARAATRSIAAAAYAAADAAAAAADAAYAAADADAAYAAADAADAADAAADAAYADAAADAAYAAADADAAYAAADADAAYAAADAAAAAADADAAYAAAGKSDEERLAAKRQVWDLAINAFAEAIAIGRDELVVA